MQTPGNIFRWFFFHSASTRSAHLLSTWHLRNKSPRRDRERGSLYPVFFGIGEDGYLVRQRPAIWNDNEVLGNVIAFVGVFFRDHVGHAALNDGARSESLWHDSYNVGKSGFIFVSWQAVGTDY